MHPISSKEEESFVRFFIDRGVNHIDVAPTYGDAEFRLGRWVKEYRKNLFLGCKTGKRTKKEASEELKRSLAQLQTDYLDLYQLHGLDDPEELKVALGENGAMNTMLEAKQQGIVKNIGITSHNPENILRALAAFDFDSVLFPVNYVLRAHPVPTNNYEPVLSLTKQRNLGVIAMKSMAKGPWPTGKKTHNCWYQPFQTQKEVDEALWFTLSQGVTTAATSSDQQVARMMIDAAERYTPMKKSEQQELLKKASELMPLFPRAK